MTRKDQARLPSKPAAARARRPPKPLLMGAAGLLFLLLVAALLFTLRKPTVHAASAPLVLTAPASPPLVAAVSKPAVPPAPLAASSRKAGTGERANRPAAEAALPLTVALTATNGGHHVKMGTGVTLTAFTAPSAGQSATLTLFFRRDQGRKTVFSFVQGSLCSTTWVASSPGRYQFTASALDSRRQTAVSPSVEITVDKPALLPIPRVAAASVPSSAGRSRPQLSAVKRLVAARPAAARPAAAPRAQPLVYHVVAAHFAASQNAVVLANALRKNGYHATVRRIADGRRKIVYVVETGTYRQPGEVFNAVATLLRSGYPAYFYTGG